VKQQESLARSVAAAREAGLEVTAQEKSLKAYAEGVEAVIAKRNALEAAQAAISKSHAPIPEHARAVADKLRPAMAALRQAADALEIRTDATLWPYPTYTQMLFQ
jgi:glutamine synthetase